MEMRLENKLVLLATADDIKGLFCVLSWVTPRVFGATFCVNLHKLTDLKHCKGKGKVRKG